MTNVLKSKRKGWESLKAGTYLQDYYDALSKDTRTALQKAIDAHDPNINVVRKKTTEDGDLQMLTPDGWEKFCIYRAKKLINENNFYIKTRHYHNNSWIDNNQEYDDIFNQNMKNKDEIKDLDIPNHILYGHEIESRWYKKMLKQDRDQYNNEF